MGRIIILLAWFKTKCGLFYNHRKCKNDLDRYTATVCSIIFVRKHEIFALDVSQL